MADRLVSFLIAGAQKCGTTALFDRLSAHPGLQMSAIKETHFFDDDDIDWAAPDYGRYHRLFAGGGGAIRGEATPIYVYWPGCFARIAAYNPAMRLIFLFRDPVERAWSHWRMEHARGVEQHSFAWCIREGRERVANARPLGHHREFSYVERGFYGQQLERAYRSFPREQLLVLASTDLAERPEATLRRVTDFLGVAPLTDEIAPVRSRIVPDCGPDAADTALLRSLYASDQERFTRLAGFGFGE